MSTGPIDLNSAEGREYRANVLDLLQRITENLDTVGYGMDQLIKLEAGIPGPPEVVAARRAMADKLLPYAASVTTWATHLRDWQRLHVVERSLDPNRHLSVK